MKNLTETLHHIPGTRREYVAFSGANATTPYLSDTQQKYQRKLFASVDEVLDRCDLHDGMTVSFHHAFREGDKVINYVMDKLAQRGLKGITLASSSLMSCNAPLIEHIRSGVIGKIYTSGMRGELADAISHGLMDEPVQIHSHGGRVNLIQKGEIAIDVAFLAVSCSDEYGNASGNGGTSQCGSLGYAMVDAQYAKKVVLLTETLKPFPNLPASIVQDRVDYVVQIESVGDPAKISVGAAVVTSNPRELMIARSAADVIEHSGYFRNGFSIQTGSGAASTACTRFMEARMRKHNIVARFALGGITGSIVDLHQKGLIEKILDTQSFDGAAAASMTVNRPCGNLHQRVCEPGCKSRLLRQGGRGYPQRAGGGHPVQRQRADRFRRGDARRVGRALRRRRGGKSHHRGCPADPQPNSYRCQAGHHPSDAGRKH